MAEGQKIVTPDVIIGHKVVETNEAKYMCLENLYQKFHRPNFYDIGGTSIQDVADFWFLFKTEQIGNIFLLHLFINNRQEGSFAVSISSNSTITVNEKSNTAYLPSTLKLFQYKDTKSSQHYVHTYTFSELEIASLKNRKLLIPVNFSDPDEIVLHDDTLVNIKLQHDFGKLLADPIDSDFIIESYEGDKFKVHKIVLSAHSEVFRAMLQHDTAESQNAYVKLMHVSTDDLQNMLEFIYTGTIKDVDNANFYSLLALADEYNLSGLKELSQYVLTQHLTVDNALDVLSLADMHNNETLKLEALQFIKKYPQVLQSDTFQEINNPQLIRELCLFIITN